jgi:hypothetical protein
MAVSDQHVAILRAMVTANGDEALRLVEASERSGDTLGLSALLGAAFTQAVERRFGERRQVSDVIRYVATVRGRAPDQDFDPLDAENMIRAGLGDSAAVEGMTDEAKADVQGALLVELMADEQLDDAGLDEFVERARHKGEQIAAELVARGVYGGLAPDRR